MMADTSGKRVVLVISRPLCEPALHNRVMPMMKLLLEQGHAIALVCPRHADNRKCAPQDVELKEVAVADIGERNFIKRAWKETLDSLKLLKRARSTSADLYLLTIPSMFLTFLAPLVLAGRKAVLDVRDLTWEYLSETQLLQRGSKRMFRMLFCCSLPFFRAVSVTNPTEMDYVARYWRRSPPPLLVSNGIARERFNSLTDLAATTEQWTVTYIGNVGLGQRLDTLIGAAERLPQVQFVIVGSGVDFERIVQLVTKKGLSNVRLTGRVTWEGLRRFYSATNVLYAQLTQDYAGAVPSKLYEYLATGKYIIYGGQGQAASTLAGFEHHQLIPPCDIEALVSAILASQRTPDSRRLSSLNRDRVAAKHIREETVEPLIRRINELVE